MPPTPDGPLAPARRRRRAKVAALAGAVLVSAALLPTSSSGAATNPGLGTADRFGVLATSTVTNTGPTVVNGDLGLSPGTSVTGFTTSTPPGPGTVNGTISVADAVAAQAVADTETAFANLGTQGCDQNLANPELGGLTFLPGVYCFATEAQLTGTVTLDAEGDPDAVFIFKTGSTLITASRSQVLLVDEASACNVFWRVGSSATLGTNTAFAGTVLSAVSISATTGASVQGRLLALEGATTLDSNVITVPECGGSTGGGSGTGGGTGTGGSTTGGSTAGGSTAGGSTTGGSTTDGTATGGTATGGTATGGTATGGTATGGTATGGTATGGSGAGTATGGTTGGTTTGGSDAATTTGGGSTRQDLPRTGSDGTGSLVRLGAVAVLAGAAAIGLARTRHLPQHRR